MQAVLVDGGEDGAADELRGARVGAVGLDDDLAAGDGEAPEQTGGRELLADPAPEMTISAIG